MHPYKFIVKVESTAALVRKRFDQFKIGDVVLVEKNQAAGIKLSESSILFVLTTSGSPASRNSIAHYVSPRRMYLVPRAVELKVVR